ncbi:Outer envelope pore protein 24, chloroplastic, partial [Mucuna pruriens]
MDLFDYDLGFKFINTVMVGEKPLKLTYEHSMKDKKTVLEGTFELDPGKKVCVNYAFDSRRYKLKHTYVHKLTTFEQAYDVAKNTWDFAVSRRVYGDNKLKASYETSNKVLGLEWDTGCFKIAGSVKLDQELKAPKLSAETTWSF